MVRDRAKDKVVHHVRNRANHENARGLWQRTPRERFARIVRQLQRPWEDGENNCHDQVEGSLTEQVPDRVLVDQGQLDKDQTLRPRGEDRDNEQNGKDDPELPSHGPWPEQCDCATGTNDAANITPERYHHNRWPTSKAGTNNTTP